MEMISLLPAVSAQGDRLLFQLDLNGESYDVAWSPDGELLAVAGSFGAKIYSQDLHEIAHLEGSANLASSVEWSPGNSQLAITTINPNGRLLIYDRDDENTFSLHTTLHSKYESQYLARWSPDGHWLATFGANLYLQRQVEIGTVLIWNAQTWQLSQTLANEYINHANTLAWSPDSTQIAGAGQDYPCLECPNLGTIAYIANTVTGDYVEIFQFPEIPSSVAYPYDNLFVVGVFELQGLDVETGNEVDRWDVPVTLLEWHRQSGHFAAASQSSGLVQIVDAFTGAILLSVQSAGQLRDISWNTDETLLALISPDGVLQLWDTSALIITENYSCPHPASGSSSRLKYEPKCPF